MTGASSGVGVNALNAAPSTGGISTTTIGGIVMPPSTVMSEVASSGNASGSTGMAWNDVAADDVVPAVIFPVVVPIAGPQQFAGRAKLIPAGPATGAGCVMVKPL